MCLPTVFLLLFEKNGINDGVASEFLITHDEGTYEIVQTGFCGSAWHVAGGLPKLHEPEQPIQRQHADAELVELLIKQCPEHACSVQSLNGPE